MKINNMADFQVLKADQAEGKVNDLPFMHIILGDKTEFCITIGLADRIGEIAAKARLEHCKPKTH